ncbi:MAG TPA: SDR family NAD(P)-dependent oxidoreductase [Solirubrobacterales bacterium]|nr:SDR family NAD(P)-dependent oxidoreductase [Solirubrobacterales bacterium]
MPGAEPPLCQVALSVTDLRRVQRWYREVLGFAPAGGTNLFAGPLASAVQGLPGAASTCWWLVDRQEFFQLELFEFRGPPVRPPPRDWRPSDVGYSMLGVHVDDLDATVRRAGAAGSPPLSEPVGSPGERRVCLRDPDGVIVELMENDPRGARSRDRPRPELPAAARSVTLSVPDLERSRRFFAGVLGLRLAEGVELHRPEHEALWGMDGATRRSLVLEARDFFVEVVEYADPRPRPWPPGYRISDQGLLNVAFGFRDRAQLDAAYDRCVAAGHRANSRPLSFGPWAVTYVNDDQGFSVELIQVARWYERRMGFRPRPTPRLAPFVGRTPARRRAGHEFRAAVVTGAAGGLGTELCRLLAADGTAIVVVDRDAAGLERLKEELGDTIEARPTDLADLEAVDGIAAELAAERRDIDLVLACAGLDRAQSMLRLDWRQARDDFSVNVLATLVLLSRLLPGMAERGTGHVTAIASLAALLGMPYEAPYSASKAALAAALESTRAELAPRGITCTTVFPGFVDTAMFRRNAFKHPYSLEPRNAAERIHAATLARRPTLTFPARERIRIGIARLLPAAIRDRLTRDAMDPDRLPAPTGGKDLHE